MTDSDSPHLSDGYLKTLFMGWKLSHSVRPSSRTVSSQASTPPRFSKRICTLIFGVIFFLAAPKADCQILSPSVWGPKNGFTIGASAAWVGKAKLSNAFAPGIETTYFHKIHKPLFFWISPGFRLWINGEATGAMPYAETGLSFLLLNAGAGYGYGTTEIVPKHSVHLFLGLNIPVFIIQKGKMIFVEPYYRPTFDVSNSSLPPGHELGLMLKFFIMRPKKHTGQSAIQ